jgi:hypothetical protein
VDADHIPVVDDVPPVRAPSWRRRCRPGKVQGRWFAFVLLPCAVVFSKRLYSPKD